MGKTENISIPSEILQGKWKALTVCWLLGLGSLLSWNSMITIGDYYYQVFPSYHPSRVLTVVYLSFALGTMAVFTYNESRINTRKRNISGFVVYFISILGCLLLDVGTSGEGGVGPYVGLCLFVGAFGVAEAHVQGGMCGDLAFMLPEFIQSYFAGIAAAGALTSTLRLITKAAFDKSDDGLRKGALLFLSIAAGIEFLCIFLYAFYFPKLPIVKYFRAKAASEGSKTVAADLAAGGINQIEAKTQLEDRFTLTQLLHQKWDYFVDIYLIYMLTLSIFPGFLYENTGTHNLGAWYAIVLIAMFNFFDLVGRYTPLIKCLKLESRKGLMIATLSRFLFIPAFYFTAKYGDQGWMIMLTSFLGLTKGHLTVCVMTVAPKNYKGPDQNAMGNLLVLFLFAGIFTGVCLDWLWIIGNGSF